ncbi:type IV pilus assembly protein PilF [Noviherbaspirillum humi]|uniref:Type IV pilus assembly protein PilF n=1 Tax=Noviherbaspirillum humi TaxID=1688639 RepID=A0A239FSR5_9BURK|nr:type IV pilus biogenesis/stability protein PilW [Noviherbaspirillum humi]SNS59173.1 type IV pilus assembly protein PilF [Noviherbaspirillum humi]
MTRLQGLTWALLLAAACLVAGCRSLPAQGSSEPSTSSDQTDSQRRARIRLQLAVGYYEQRQTEVALDEVKQALLADPAFADAYSLRGLIYMDMGEAKLAEENLQQAIRFSPANPDFNNNYGWFLCQNGRERQAIGYFETALKSRGYQSPDKALANAGLCSLKLQDRAAAERYFMQAFQFNPANSTANIGLARIFYQQRDYERARFYANRAVSAEGAGPEALWLAVRIERKLGNRDAETSLATQLRRRFPRSAEYSAYERGAFDE